MSLFIAVCANAVDWRPQLYLDGGRPHAKRVEIVIENPQKVDSDGDLLFISAKELGLVGRPAKELRIVAENGRELMYAVSPETDTIAQDTSIGIPVRCQAGKKTSVWLYFENPSAWELPSNLKGNMGNEKLDFENISKLPVKGWSDNSKSNYFNKLEIDGGHSGKQCISTTALAGSKPDWICVSKSFPVTAGCTYKISAWVKGENVKGAAGFYMHIGGVNRSIHKDKFNGTFDWQKVEFEGVVPEGVKHISFGTVLYAKEGKAWFDDFDVKIDYAKSSFKYKIKPVESLEFRKIGESSAWEMPKSKYPSRIVLSSFNFSKEPAKDSLCMVPINRITNANYTSDAFAVVLDGKQVPFFLASGNIIFQIGNIPAKTEKVFYVYINKDRKNQTPKAKAKQMSGILSDYEADVAVSADAKSFETLMNSPANLFKNSSFEDDSSWSIDKNKDAQVEFVDGGLFGKRAAKLKIGKNNAAWVGLRQFAKSKSDANYMILGWARCPDGKAGAVNAHSTVKGVEGFSAYSTPVTGDQWQLFSMFIASRGEGSIQAHLTATSGDYLYDGIIAAQCLNANLVEIQSAMDKEANGLAVWQVDNLVKIFAGDAPMSTSQATLALAKNEDEGMQLGIRNASAVKNLEVSASAPVFTGDLPLLERVKIFFGKAQKPTLPVPEIGNVGNVVIDTKSNYFHFTDLKSYERFVPPTQFGVLYPDPILPFAKFDLDAKSTKCVYLIFSAPKDAKAGVYEGSVEFKADGKVIKTMPYKIRIYDFALSDDPQCYAIFDVRLGAGREFKNYTMHEAAKFMRSKKLSVDSVPANIGFKLVDGKPVPDFEAFDKECEFYLNELRLPYLYLPFRAGSFGWANPPAPYLGENPYPGKWPYDESDHSKLNPKYRQLIVDSLKMISQHLEQKGWLDRFMFYISDEPFAKRQDIEKQMIALCDMIHEGAPKIKIYCSTWYYVPQWDGKLDIWGIGAQGQTSEDDIQTIHKLGADIITTTDGQFVLDNPYNALERLLPLYCYKYGFRGYEFWGADWYTLNPLKWGIHRDIPQSDTPGKHYRVRYPNGDGYIFYPGQLVGVDKPFSSLRMESHRDGVEDFEYYKILDKLAKKYNDKPALETLERLKSFAFIPNAGGRNAVMLLPDPIAYSRIRNEIAMHIERLNSLDLK